jgi:hypothetical protein
MRGFPGSASWEKSTYFIGLRVKNIVRKTQNVLSLTLQSLGVIARTARFNVKKFCILITLRLTLYRRTTYKDFAQ